MFVSEALDAALASLKDRKLDAALESLVSAWRARPAVELAAAITALGARLDADQSPLGGKTPGEREEQWRAKAGQNKAAQLSQLLATVTDTKGSDQTRERLQVLLANGNDPRLTDRIAQMLLVPPYNGSVSRTTPFWKLVFERLAKLGDPRVVALARRLPEAWKVKELSDYEREALNKRLKTALPAITAAWPAVPVLDAGELETLTKVNAAISDSSQRAAEAAAPSKRSREELLRAVYESPADDAPRLVFADFLQEQGDPRGEFITLQFKKRDAKLTRDEATREKELLAEHGRSWLGAIEKKVNKGGMVFERGFLSVCKASAVDSSWEWSTVRELETAGFASKELRLASLRVFIGEAVVLDLLPQVTRLITRGPHGMADVDRAFLDGRKKWAVPRPAIESLELSGDDIWCSPVMDLRQFEWLRDGFPTLRELSLPFPLSKLDEWRRFGDELKVDRLELKTHPRTRGAFVLVFTRGDDGRLSRLRVEGKEQELTFYGSINPGKADAATLIAAIAALAPDALTSFELASWKAPPELKAALSKQKRLA